jgi:hypothetical protein
LDLLRVCGPTKEDLELLPKNAQKIELLDCRCDFWERAEFWKKDLDGFLGTFVISIRLPEETRGIPALAVFLEFVSLRARTLVGVPKGSVRRTSTTMRTFEQMRRSLEVSRKAFYLMRALWGEARDGHNDDGIFWVDLDTFVDPDGLPFEH